mmetsp:Transcript_34399/g.53675  ORF Transcript_34399/g.53675 Transcript_34399/m.53675 type:complete len:143 (+) Transcript_34399:430-858(+)
MWMSSPMYKSWIALGEQAGVEPVQLLELWQSSQEDGYAVIVDEVSAYTIGLSVLRDFDHDLNFYFDGTREPRSQELRELMARWVQELRTSGLTSRLTSKVELGTADKKFTIEPLIDDLGYVPRWVMEIEEIREIPGQVMFSP